MNKGGMKMVPFYKPNGEINPDFIGNQAEEDAKKYWLLHRPRCVEFLTM